VDSTRTATVAGVRTLVTRHAPNATVIEDGPWLRVGPERLDDAIRSGWKLHLSAAPARYFDLLDAALPILERARVMYKCAATTDVVERLNDGDFGLTQVGKAVTVYPPDEAAGADVAGELAAALAGLPGPRVPTDSRFDPNAPVYYRFGPFDAAIIVDPMGRRRRVVALPDAGQVIDTTDGGAWDPPASVFFPAQPPHDHLAFLRDRYAVVGVLQVSARGGSFLAIPIAAEGRCVHVLKTGRAGAHADSHGRDAVWALRHEHGVLGQLRGTTGVPEAGALLESEETAAIARPWIDGDTFAELWTAPTARAQAGRRALADVVHRLAAVLNDVHAAGIVVRDVSPGNVVVDKDAGAVHLLDFELAQPSTDDAPPYRRGTWGYYDPAKQRTQTPTLADDRYAVGALAFQAIVGLAPSLFPDGWTAYPNPAVQTLAASRFSASAFDAELRQFLDLRAVASKLERPGALADLRARLLQAADGCVSNYVAHGGTADALNVYSGAAGAVLAALECAPNPTEAETLHERATDLCEMFEAACAPMQHVPGLYFGAAGVGLASIVLGDATGAASSTAAGERILDAVPWEDSVVPDVCQGVAGYILARLVAFERTQKSDHLAAAVAAAERLAAMAETIGDDTFWPWPEGDFGSLSGARLYGFGHGVAGVGYTFARLAQYTGDAAHHAQADAAWRTLARAAQSVDGEPNACWWAVSPEDDAAWNAWCHGNPGVVKFLTMMHANGIVGDTSLLERAARGVAAANNEDYCLCHGIASRLDAYAAVLNVLDAPWLRDEADADAVRLRQLDLERLEAVRSDMRPDAEPRGLMTGPMGAYRTLLRHRVGRDDGAANFRPILP